MANVHQFQVQYDRVQDRLMLRIRTTEAEELRFWLTRRFTSLLLQALDRIAQADPQVQVQPAGPVRDSMVEFKRETALAQADFGQNFQKSKPSPVLGTEPVLLARIRVVNGDDGQRQLRLDPLKGNGVQIALNDNILHSINKLLTDGVQRAQWGLKVSNQLAVTAAAATKPH